MKHATRLLIGLLVVGCATQHTTSKPNSYSLRDIYAIPESEAFAIAGKAIVSAIPSYNLDKVEIGEMGGDFRGYRVFYQALTFPRVCFAQRLYVLPVAGVTSSGQEVYGFRFEITGRGGSFVRGAEQDRELARTLKAALDATGTVTAVTNLRIRPYAEASPPTVRRVSFGKPSPGTWVFSNCPS